MAFKMKGNPIQRNFFQRALGLGKKSRRARTATSAAQGGFGRVIQTSTPDATSVPFGTVAGMGTKLQPVAAGMGLANAPTVMKSPVKDTETTSEKFRKTVDETKQLSTTDEKAQNLSDKLGVEFTYTQDTDGRMRYLTSDGFTAKEVAINNARKERGLEPLTKEMLKTTVSADETDKKILNASRDMDILGIRRNIYNPQN